VTLTPKQRARRMAKAMDHFEEAYVLLCDELRDLPRNDVGHMIFRNALDDAHLVVRRLRIEAEAAQNAPDSPETH